MVDTVTELLQAARRLAGDRSAATAIEYALIAGGLSIAIAAAVSGIGETVLDFFTSAEEGFQELE